MKKSLLTIAFLLAYVLLFAQKVDSIYFNLYTDSLKKGTYNYINVEGKMSNGRILPLDSSQLIFTASYGKFSGNTLWLPFEATIEKIDITVKNRQNPALVIYHTIYVKKQNDDANLKIPEEIMDTPQRKNKKRRE